MTYHQTGFIKTEKEKRENLTKVKTEIMKIYIPKYHTNSNIPLI